MGTDNLFHKSRARQEKKLARKKRNRASFDKILIVSEGKVTEPLYFTNIKNAYKIPNANIVVDTDSDSSPCKILKRAEQLYSKAKKENDPFDKVYCVFDQDSHETYNQTIQKIKSKKPRNTFFTITSVSCFEFWLLLHFKYSSAPFHQTGKLSIAATALKELQKRFPDYTKDYKDLFSYLGDKKLRFAIDNAQKLRAHNQKTHQSNPSINLDQLVTYLQSQQKHPYPPYLPKKLTHALMLPTFLPKALSPRIIMNNTIKQITAIALLSAMAGTATFSLSTTTAQADEGQWQPHQIANMQDKFDELGLKLPAHQVANLTQYPMNAMVGLGYCSASFVSPKGLVVTNHHCAYGAIQYNTTPEQNRIRDGFLAQNLSEELSAGPQERLYITEKVTDVTDKVLGGIEATTSGKKYYDAIQDARKKLIKDCESDQNYRCSVRAFHHGKEYFLLKNLMIKDVRLVYAPPEAVGAFGGDIDNFEYPRHTGDFTFVRAYVDKNGNPAPYHKDNVPYKPKSYLKISAAGVKEGDGIILAGTPGRTSRYKLASEIEFAASWDYPVQVERALQTLDIIERATKGDATAKVAYSSTVKSINNRMKKRQGLLDGFKVTDIHAIKKDKEQQLLQWIGADKSRQQYAKTHQQLSKLIEKSHAQEKQAFYYDYATDSTLIQVATQLYRLAKESEKPDAMRKMGYQERNLPMIKARLNRLNKRFEKKVDRAIWAHFLTQYAKRPKAERVAAFDQAIGLGGPLSISEITKAYYSSTNLDDKEKRLAWIGKPASEFEASKDPFIILAVKMYETNMQMEAQNDELRGQLAQTRPRYMEAIIAYNQSKGQPVYPDANGTLRITIGSVGGYPAADGIYKTPFTSVKGMMLKNTGVAPFNVPTKIQDAYAQNRFGPYRQAKLEKGKRFNDIPVNFLSSADTTGGNSGSPVLNGRGELVGLNFDSTYESITKDWYFNAEITRAIHVDIRYVLWLLDEVEQADHLIKEMNVIYNM